MSSLSIPELIKVRSTLARALSVEDVNDLGRTTGQAERLRLSRLLAEHPGRHLDVDVEFARETRLVGFRVPIGSISRICRAELT